MDGPAAEIVLLVVRLGLFAVFVPVLANEECEDGSQERENERLHEADEQF